MEEDTIIALGFAVGAAVLIILISVWVIVYCICCRQKQQTRVHRKQLPEQEQFRYVSDTYNQKINDPVSSLPKPVRPDTDMRYRELPALPKTNRPKIATPDEQLAHTNGGFVSSVDGLYTYCDSLPSIPDYPAPCPPNDKPQYKRLSSRESLFLEMKYNIKSDDADDVHNGRSLSKAKRLAAIASQHEQIGQETYADVNYIQRMYSVLEDSRTSCPPDVQVRITAAPESGELSTDHEILNINQNAQMSEDEASAETGSNFSPALNETDDRVTGSDSDGSWPRFNVEDGVLKDASSSSVDTQSTLQVVEFTNETDTDSDESSADNSRLASPSASSDSKSFTDTIYSHSSTLITGRLKEIEEISFDLSVKDAMSITAACHHTQPAGSSLSDSAMPGSFPHVSELAGSASQQYFNETSEDDDEPTPDLRNLHSESHDSLTYAYPDEWVETAITSPQPTPKPRRSLEKRPDHSAADTDNSTSSDTYQNIANLC